jgi:hypothetical protein
MTTYDKVKQLIEEAKQAGEHRIFVGREFHKDEHDLWLDNETMNRLESEGFRISRSPREDEWKIKW